MSGVADPDWIDIARDLVGVREIHGPQTEPKIAALWRDAGLPFTDDETAWCAGFVGGVLARAKIKPSGSAAARSYMHWGLDVLQDGRQILPVGAVCVFSRPPNPFEGHVAFAVGTTSEGALLCLGGNQHDSVNIAPFSFDRLIAARWPVERGNDLAMLKRLPTLAMNAPLSTNEA